MKSCGILNYLQPDFYHFSNDSVDLAKLVIENFSFENGHKILDICAGCGVIGFEIISRIREHVSLLAVELQTEYRYYFFENLKQLRKENASEVELLVDSFTVLNGSKYLRYFDLIICNPPYFDSASNRPSPDDKKNICRLIDRDSRKLLFDAIINSLAPDGICFMVLRKDQKIVEELFKLSKLNSKIIATIGENLFIESVLNVN